MKSGRVEKLPELFTKRGVVSLMWVGTGNTIIEDPEVLPSGVKR
jgi:hypothetical protein